MAEQLSFRERFRFETGALPNGEALHVLRFSGEEGFNRLFAFDLSLCTQKADVSEDELLASPATLVILRSDGSKALFSGYPTSVTLASSYNGWRFWRLRLQPAIWKLTQQVESRIFLDRTVQELAKDALAACAVPVESDFRLYGSYEKQDFSMQHGESLYNFLAWKLERDGIYYFFDETDAGGRIVFADAKESHADIPGGAELRYSPTSGLEAVHKEEIVTSFAMTAQPLPKRVVLRDYDWENPMRPLAAIADVSDKGLGDAYFYGEGFSTQAEGKRLADIRAQALRCHAKIFRGESAVPSMRPGFVFTLSNHFNEPWNRGYLVTDVRHEGSQEAWLSQAVGVPIENPDDRLYYRNSFACIPDSVQFRPERRTERARVSGMITAFIDGSSDSAVAEVNEKGCYKVVFPEDLSDRANGKSSCWIRRMQPHVGLGHGTTFPLTPGVEVLVAFIDGNPDRPVIAGAVANPVSGFAENQASAQSTAIRTAGGCGLVFSDKETKQGLQLGTGGRSGLFMNSGSLDATIAYTDFAGALASSAETTFAGIAKHAVSGFSSKLEANHKGFTLWTGILQAMKALAGVTAVCDEAFLHAAMGKEKDADRKKSQTWASVAAGLTDLLKAFPATFEAVAGTGAIGAKDPFYGAAVTSAQGKSTVALNTPMDAVHMKVYLAFAVLSFLVGCGTEGSKAVAAWLSSEKSIQESKKKALVVMLTGDYAEELRKEHPDWPPEKVLEEAKIQAQLSVDAKGGALLSENAEEVDKMLEEAGITFNVAERAKWHKMGRSIGQSLATTLIPELVATIAVWKKSGKVTGGTQLGGLLLCAQDSNAVLAARKDTRISSDKNLFLAAGSGQSIFARYKQESDLADKLTNDLSLGDNDSTIAMRADAIKAAALKDIESVAAGRIKAEAADSITFTTKYDNAAIARIAKGCAEEAEAAAAAAPLHVQDLGTDAGAIAARLATDAGQLHGMEAMFAAPPADHATFKLGKDGTKQQVKINCQSPGCAIGIAGTATDAAGELSMKMENAGGSVSSLGLKDDKAEIKASKGGGESSLSLAGKKADLASMNARFSLDGNGNSAALKAGENDMKAEAGGFSFKTNADFAVKATQNVKLDGTKVDLLGGNVSFTKAAIDAKASGTLKLDASIIKIG